MSHPFEPEMPKPFELGAGWCLVQTGPVGSGRISPFRTSPEEVWRVDVPFYSAATIVKQDSGTRTCKLQLQLREGYKIEKREE